MAPAVWPMTPGELIAVLASHNVAAVVVGGIAMRLHDSPRVTQDLDLGIASSAVDDAVRILYQNGYVLVSAVAEKGATLLGSVEAALAWMNETDPGALTFVERPATVDEAPACDVPHDHIRVESQVDLLYDLSVPFGRLMHEAEETTLSGVPVRYASARHLLVLKEARPDPSAADDADIAFLRARLAD